MRKINLYAIPSQTWFSIFVALPLLFVLSISFLKKGTYGGIEFSFTLDNYFQIFTIPILKIFIFSIAFSVLTTVIIFLIALPIVWKLIYLNEFKKKFFLTMLCFPFFMNLIVKIYSIKLITPILSLPDFYWVLFAMITTYFPFMLFPLYSAFDKIDKNIISVAKDLGANTFEIMLKVLFPILKKTIRNAALLVFIPCFGEYVIPDLLGGAKIMLVGNLISEFFLKSRDWPLGSALSVLIIIFLVFLTSLMNRTQEG